MTNEGSTDYRYIPSKTQSADPNIKEKYIKPSDVKHAINSNDSLIISLKQVFIADFYENRKILDFFRSKPATGEIALVVNAFEIGKGESVTWGSDGKKNARVIFYSEDVQKGQFLNLSNLSSIYGPIKYDGGPFILDLYVIEMDTPGEQQRQMLSNLASIGATFYPPASPLAGPLATLARTLITDNQDDIAYHYTAEFKFHEGGDPYLNTGILQTGNYVFIREKDRNISTNWKNIDLDERTGRLIYSSAYKPNCVPDTNMVYQATCEYRENSYIVVEVNTAITEVVTLDWTVFPIF